MKRLTCEHVLELPVPASGLGMGAVKAAVLCGRPAVMVILCEQDVGFEEHEIVLVAVGYCDDHAAEEAHEARASMDEDEYLIVPIPEPRPEVMLNKPNHRGLTTEERRHVRQGLMDLGFTRTSPSLLTRSSHEAWRDRGDGQYTETWAHEGARGYGLTLTWGAKATDENGDPL